MSSACGAEQQINKNMSRTQTRTQYSRTSSRADKFSVIWSAFTNAALPELANRPGFCQRDLAVRDLDKTMKSFGQTFEGQDIAPPTLTGAALMPWSDCMAIFHPPTTRLLAAAVLCLTSLWFALCGVRKKKVITRCKPCANALYKHCNELLRCKRQPSRLSS